jgi:hypothetical protein
MGEEEHGQGEGEQKWTPTLGLGKGSTTQSVAIRMVGMVGNWFAEQPERLPRFNI